MKRTVAPIIGFVCMLVAGLAAAQIVLYEREGLRGRSFTANRPIDNLDNFGFNDRASSAIVERGQWEICEHAFFQGRCITLRAGQYPSLGSMGMNNIVSSVRPVSGRPQSSFAPLPPPGPSYAFYPHWGEQLFHANVVAVRAVMGPPEQRCWIEQQQVTSNDQPNVGGAILGGVLGGVLGHQIGSGRGNSVATAIGAVGGAAVGANVNRGSQTYTQNVQRCATVPSSGTPAYWDVTYVFRGATHRAQLAFAPGATITVNSRGEPRV